MNALMKQTASMEDVTTSPVDSTAIACPGKCNTNRLCVCDKALLILYSLDFYHIYSKYLIQIPEG